MVAVHAAAVTLTLALALLGIASATPCATDTDCSFGDKKWRCCGATKHAENCPASVSPNASTAYFLFWPPFSHIFAKKTGAFRVILAEKRGH